MNVRILLACPAQSEMLQLVPYAEQKGWEITTMETGAEALHIVEQERPHAAIVYLNLLDMSGWDVLERIRSSSLMRTTPVILVYPAGASDEDYLRGHQLGADVAVASPFKPLEIVNFVSRITL